MEQMFFMVIPIRIKIFKELKFYRKILIVMNYVKFSLNLYKQNLHYLVDANYTTLHSTKLVSEMKFHLRFIVWLVWYSCRSLCTKKILILSWHLSSIVIPKIQPFFSKILGWFLFLISIFSKEKLSSIVQSAHDIPRTSSVGFLKVLTPGTYRESSRVSQGTNRKIDNLMIKLYFGGKSTCIIYLFLFFKKELIFESPKWGCLRDVLGMSARRRPKKFF